METPVDLVNREVRFRLRDVFVPPAREVLEELHGEDFLEGRIVGLTKRGVAQELCAVVEVKGLRNVVIVPLEHVIRLTD